MECGCPEKISEDPVVFVSPFADPHKGKVLKVSIEMNLFFRQHALRGGWLPSSADSNSKLRFSTKPPCLTSTTISFERSIGVMR
jgi:hypothetical protein